ncbi:MAG: hypothetical protein JOZ99_05125 [Actinobacteria bacterium]|nr:hypothetical protein [Actinomycetota bacterium]
MIGKVYNIPPQPPVAANTRYLDAGAVTFGVEYREVDPESLVATYEGNAAHLAELEDRSPEGGFSDEGVSIHVCATADGREYLRFDVFDDEPHYHYVHHDGDEIVNNVIDFDTVAHGEMLPWVMAALRTRLAAMLTEAGGASLVPQVDPALVDPVVDEVERLATRAQQAHRAAARA